MQYSPAPAVHEDTVRNSFSISPAVSGSSNIRSKSMKVIKNFLLVLYYIVFCAMYHLLVDNTMYLVLLKYNRVVGSSLKIVRV